jgi:hypothetical protein
MRKSILVDQKRGRGRPATGRDPMISARIPVEVLAKLDEWAANNECTRSTAAAELLAKALAAKPGRKRKPDKAGNVL